MHSWIFRNRRRLEAIYDAPGRSLARRDERSRARDREHGRAAAGAGASTSGARDPRQDSLMVYELYPRARRRAA